MKKASLIIIIFVLFLYSHVSGQSQSVLFWIKIHDTAGGGDSLIYGNNANATFGVDSNLAEFSSPPDAPGFWAKFLCPRSPAPVDWGLGLIKRDIRAFPLYPSPLHVDTFIVYFTNDDIAATNASVTLQWAPLCLRQSKCDSMFLVDTTHTILPQRIDMFTQDSVVLPDIYDPNGINPHAPVFRFHIFVYGVTALIDECGALPDIYTDFADDIDPVSATLHGRIDPNCESLDSVRFQYGLTNTYGSEVRAVHDALNQYSAHLMNLKPGITYHFRIAPYLSMPNECRSHPEYGPDNIFTTEPPSTMFWIRIEDTYAGIDSITMLFGNHIYASCGVDTFLNEYCRPPTAPGFEYSWLLSPSCWHSCQLGALLQRDLRPITTSAQLDTFWLNFANDVADPQTSVTLRWPSSSYIRMRTDSLVLDDPTHTLLPRPVDMTSMDSVVFTRPFDPEGVNPSAPGVRLIIYKYGVHMPLVDAVKPEKVRKPTAFALYQNYPNPFNPVTKIQFDIPTASDVSLKIFNILGQEVATLVNDRRVPGNYAAEFDGSKFASGVYIYRIVTTEFIHTKKMLLIK